MTQRASTPSVFDGARSVNRWQPRPVAPETLRAMYDVLKAGPTSANGFPLRLVLASSDDAKEQIAATAMSSNQECLRNAPVVAIVAYDLHFFADLETRFEGAEGMKALFASNAELAEITALRNGTLQGGYLLYAARAVGLDYAPMSGFDNAAIDAAFFEGTTVRSNFLCGLGYGDYDGLGAAPPRPGFERICTVV